MLAEGSRWVEQAACSHGPRVQGYTVQLWRTGAADSYFKDPATSTWAEVLLLVGCADQIESTELISVGFASSRNTSASLRQIRATLYSTTLALHLSLLVAVY